MTKKKTSGIYAIVNTVNGKRYVGSSTNIEKRKVNHLALLRGNYHQNDHLQKAWNKYGERVFNFLVIEEVPIEQLLDVEQMYLDANANGYNIALVAGTSPMAGRKHSDKSRNKNRLSHLGRKQSVETKEKHRLSMLGNKHGCGNIPSEETRDKLRTAMRGNSNGKGYQHTKEAKHKISLALKGKPRLDLRGRISPMRGKHLSDETKAKISEATRGKKKRPHKRKAPSIEHRRKLSLVWLNRKHTEESRMKMKESWKLRKLQSTKIEE